MENNLKTLLKILKFVLAAAGCMSDGDIDRGRAREETF